MIPAAVVAQVDTTLAEMRTMDGVADVVGSVTVISRVGNYIYKATRTGNVYRVTLAELGTAAGRRLQECEAVLLKTQHAPHKPFIPKIAQPQLA